MRQKSGQVGVLPKAPGVRGVDGFQIFWLQMIADIYRSNYLYYHFYLMSLHLVDILRNVHFCDFPPSLFIKNSSKIETAISPNPVMRFFSSFHQTELWWLKFLVDTLVYGVNFFLKRYITGEVCCL